MIPKNTYSSFIFAFIFAFHLLFSCKNEDSNNRHFQGTYIGTVTYQDNETHIVLEEAAVEVLKVEDTYQIHFPQAIPVFPELIYEELHTATINVGADSTHLVRITNNTLQIDFSNELGATWTAKCTQ